MLRFLYLLLPLTILAGTISVANLLSYGLLQLTGELLSADKLISKVTQLLLVILIFPLKKWLKFNWFDLGFTQRKIFIKQLLQGFGLSLLTLSPMLLMLYLMDVHSLDTAQHWTLDKIAGKISAALLLALLIAVFEEILFRGLLLTSLKQKFSTVIAICVSAIYYAELHFLKSKTTLPAAKLDLGSGFLLMQEAFANLLNPAILSALLSLFIIGTFLAIIRTQLPNSIGICIGCHCGWVWQIKISKDFCNVNTHSDYLFLVSNYDGVIGPMVSFWLTVAIIGFLLLNNWQTIRQRYRPE